MKASRRNIVIAVVLLAVLLVLPFWPKIRQALAPAAGEEVSCTVTVALVFGYLTDLGVWVIQGIPVPSYGVRWLLCLAGVFLVGVGVALEVVAGVVTLAGEGFVLAVCRVTPFPFGNLKVAFDVLLVGVASLLSLLCLHGLYGVREGTLAAALGVGLIAKRLQPPLQAWFTKRLP